MGKYAQKDSESAEVKIGEYQSDISDILDILYRKAGSGKI